MLLDVSDKKIVKEGFSEWLEIQDQRKELSAVNKEIIDKMTEVLEVKAPIVNKLFRVLKKKAEGEEDELDVLVNLMVEIED